MTHSAFGRALADLRELTREDDIWAQMSKIMAREFSITAMSFAFTHSVYAAQRVGLTDSLLIRYTVPKDALDAHDGLALDTDVVINTIMRGNQEVIWTDVDVSAMSRAELARHELDLRLGFGVGMSFGLRFGGRSGASCLCMGARHADAAEFNLKVAQRKSELNELVQEFDRHMRTAMVSARLRLSPRQRDVLALSAGGMSAKQIADRLELSPRTVAHSLERARKSLGARSTMEAVAKAIVFELVG